MQEESGRISYSVEREKGGKRGCRDSGERLIVTPVWKRPRKASGFGVEIFADDTGRLDHFRVWAIAAVDEADLIGFAVAAADEGLIAVLEVVATDDMRVLHSTLDEAPESPGPFGLVGAGSRTTGSHAAIGAAEIERTDQNRFVYDPAAIATGDELSGTVCVNIDGKDIGVAGGGFPDVRRLSKALERAGEKEFLRREGFDGLPADSEIAVEPFAAEEDGIGTIAFTRNGVAQLREFLPDPEMGTPSGIQRRKR